MITTIATAASTLRQRRTRRQFGFTLIELLVVISMISILAAMGVAQYRNSVRRTEEATLKTDLFHMRDAIDQYYADKGKYPSSIDSLVSDAALTSPVGSGVDRVEAQAVRVGDDPALRLGDRGREQGSGVAGQHQLGVRRRELAVDELGGAGTHVVDRHGGGERLRRDQQGASPLGRAPQLGLQLVAPRALHLRLVPHQPQPQLGGAGVGEIGQGGQLVVGPLPRHRVDGAQRDPRTVPFSSVSGIPA